MKEYKKLLVVIDPTTDEQIALTRAMLLAKRSNATITAFLSIFDLSYELTSFMSSTEREAMRQGVIAQRTAWLKDIINKHHDDNVDIDFNVVWHNRPFESIIKKAIDDDYQLIIKATHEHDKLKAVIFTPTDWHLLRKAPMPVMLVKEHQWDEDEKIICAVDVSSDDEEQIALNHKIIKYAKDLSKKFGAHIHLVNGYPGTPVNLTIELPEFDANEFSKSVSNKHKQRIQELATAFAIPVTNCHVEEGLPEDIIPDLAKQLNAEIVVMGTIGRAGFSAALIGNTAEHVIDRLNCDLLAIKPADFISPLQE